MSRMKLNWELTDHCSTLVLQVHQHKQVAKKNRFLVSYIMSRLTGRKFLQHLSENGPGGTTVKDILSSAWTELSSKEGFTPSDFFSQGFNPQRRHGHMARNMDKETFLSLKTLKEVFHVSPRPPHINLKDKDNRNRSKRQVMKEIRQMRGCGPFTAKNFWRILTSYSRSTLKTPSYSECGSGARARGILSAFYQSATVRIPQISLTKF